MVNAARGKRSSSFLLHSLHYLDPLGKMALGFGISKADSVDNSSDDINNKTADDFKDAEKGSVEDPGGRRMSRLEGVNRRDMNSDDEASISIGKQIELEAGNAIQYRTCSWQKVCLPVSGAALSELCMLFSPAVLIQNADCGLAFLRVHLPSHHVVPVVIFHSRSGAGPHPDGCGRRACPVHFSDLLVSRPFAVPLFQANI